MGSTVGEGMAGGVAERLGKISCLVASIIPKRIDDRSDVSGVALLNSLVLK
ncbi:hypothetical protein SSPO_094080 [Streptomyces antimycoticus]|uniref:Uncharacterized protein n=1 Tax=Streptomyces antimycoticus TaxID=68175 RepID=A0A499V1I1_9ACTN|nr:hypothetical protein SSPO_094080 [Streptomyces antimycoticus]